MASLATILFFAFTLLLTIAEAGKGKEKIVIHVPYKILKHHHTHTKYKVITIPAPKKENTIIYLKEEPTYKYIPQVQTHMEETDTKSKIPEPFEPPHQQSASALLESLAKHKEESSVERDQQQEYSTIKGDQQPPEPSSEEHFVPSLPYQTPEPHIQQNFVPSLTYKPMMLTSSHNFVPNFSLKSVPVVPKHHVYSPKLIMSPVQFHPSYEAYLPKFTYQSILHMPQGHFTPKITFKQNLPQRVLQDNVAHASEQVYSTMMNPSQKIRTYKVKEENQEGLTMQSLKHQQTTLNTVPVPSLMKSTRKGKKHFQQGQNYQLIPSDPDYEYEHVGYLIIDGKSKKIVGKNFKDPIHLSR